MGRATARAFAGTGASVVLADIAAAAVAEAAEELTAAGHDALGVACDVADEPAERFDRVTAINLRGYVAR
jgi:NAD(P)-dependent dehydrogenase (short-subunit alcohol dehydrogenase family)